MSSALAFILRFIIMKNITLAPQARHGVSNQLDSLFNNLPILTTAGYHPHYRLFVRDPPPRSYAENESLSWRHHKSSFLPLLPFINETSSTLPLLHIIVLLLWQNIFYEGMDGIDKNQWSTLWPIGNELMIGFVLRIICQHFVKECLSVRTVWCYLCDCVYPRHRILDDIKKRI